MLFMCIYTFVMSRCFCYWFRSCIFGTVCSEKIAGISGQGSCRISCQFQVDR